MYLMELHHSVHQCIKPDGMTSTALYSLTHNTLIYKIRCELNYHAALIMVCIHFVRCLNDYVSVGARES